MKRTIKNLALVAIAVFAFSSCTRVEPGYKALKVFALGENKGKIEVVGIGRHPVNIFGYYDYYRYPTNLQQWSWTASGESSKGDNQEIVFQVEGQELKVDIGIAFNFAVEDPMLVKMFEYFRCEPDEIVSKHFRKDVRSFFNEVTANMKVEEVYSTAKEAVRKEVFQLLVDKYKPLGVEVVELTYLSPIRLPQVLKDAVDTKIVAKQNAEARENEVAEKEAEARKLIAEQNGKAEAARIEAKGKADAMDIEGRAIARNPQLLKLKEIENQAIWGKSASGWNYVNFSAGQASSMFNIPNK